jgi:vancomycin aglycone glucosyltransferase
MKALISSVGTRGDVQPALALALALRDQGGDVSLCVSPNFVDWAERLGLPARPMGVEMRAPRPGETPPAAPPRAADLIADQLETLAAAADGCNVLVGGGVHQYALRSVAEATGVPAVVAAYAPTSLPAAERLATWAEEQGRWNARALDRVNAGRAALGLPAIDDVLDHILGKAPWLACDPVLGPAPEAPGRDVVQTGAWLMADDSPLPDAVEAFLAAGEAPVYLGLGSMPAAPRTAATLIAAARALGRRAILAEGWAGLTPDTDDADVLSVADLNHAALFPRVAAVAHHGGAGTTLAAARAGAPQVIAPMFGDQPYWSARVRALGIGTSPPPASGLEAAALAEAIGEALRPQIAERARAVAPRIVADGASAAARRLLQAVG